ncbi:MAG: DUF2169 domain-containing protein, partial [Deltaproteobacteria bacterium]|nr:DUF2169 domain-containing protein [Deltaproteobacteria bacterium]
MKVVKDQEQGVLLNYFGMKNKYFLSISILTFFSLDQPDQPLREQELWPLVKDELGPEAVLDLGMPKPRGEVLLQARCYSAPGHPIQAGEVLFRLGKIVKRLAVFGPRYWKEIASLVTFISDPEPFSVMDISYKNAFGGKDYSSNPLGRGFFPDGNPVGAGPWPLPTVEFIDNLIGAPEDVPGPAGFSPYDFTWPQRTKYQGTYTQNWLRQDWPNFPDDFSWSYYNAAPEDQRLADGFFQGHEPISLINMHPTRSVIESRLSGLKPRCFLHRLADPRQPQGDL